MKVIPFISDYLDLISRVPSSRLHIEFIKGPDLTVESLYREFRVFGRIVDINLQKSTDKEIPRLKLLLTRRFASVQFLRKRAATSARNCIHGEMFENTTTIAIGYEKQHGWGYHFYQWFLANLRISIFLLLGFLAGFTYLVFDPWRAFSITNQITGRYSFSQYARSASRRFDVLKSFVSDYFNPDAQSEVNVMSEKPPQFTEREAQTKLLSSYFKQAPESLILVSGPKGSGKTAFVQQSLQGHNFHLIVKCDDLVGKGDYQLISHLTSQLNFFPSLGVAGQLSGFIDTIITATTGAKAGLATTNDGEVRKILECATLAIQKLTEKQISARTAALRKLETSGDGSLTIPEIEYPVVVIDDFLSKENIREQWIYPLLTQWAAQLNEYRIANVVFISDHPSAAPTMGKGLTTLLN